MTESFAAIFAESLPTINMTPGSLVTGIVVAIDQECVTVHVGLKSEGVIPKGQFLDGNNEFDLCIGDPVKVVMEIVDDGMGETHMSREKARRAEVWEKLNTAFANNESVDGVINDKVKGGYTVNIQNIRAFLPGSLVDIRPIRDTDVLEGTTLQLKIIKLDQKRNNVVVSRRAVLEAENSVGLQKLLDSFEAGQELTGIVKNLTEYGAFVDLGGIDGLLHVTDMAWRRIRHPSEVVELGQELKVKILRFDSDRNRVSLGLKQLGDDPWQGVTERYPVNTVYKATITNIAEYGCFAELEEGIEGLVHVSEMAWASKNVYPSKLVKVGEEVDVMVLSLEESRRRISLGMRQCQANPWETFAEQHQPGHRIQGHINSITDFGIFVSLDGSIDGLVYLADIDWNEPGEEAVKRYSKGAEIEVVVLSVDPQRERVSLGIKQLEQDAFTDYLVDKRKGSVVEGKVISLGQQQAVVELAEGVEATLKANEIDVSQRVDDLRAHFEQGQKIAAAISNIDRKQRTVWLSIKLMQINEEAQALKTHRMSVQEEVPVVGTIGDLIKKEISRQQETNAANTIDKVATTETEVQVSIVETADKESNLDNPEKD